MKLLKLVGVLGTLGMLAGCSSDIEKMRTVEAVDGTAFTRALTEEYRQLTVFEADDQQDWVDAGYFARKGLAAAAGDVVLPEELGIWDLPPETVVELSDARGRLMHVMDNGARDSNPEQAAKAQARFDCWVEQQEENHQPDHIAACKDEFWAAMAVLEGAPAMVDEVMEPRTYIVLFDFDKADIRPDGQAVIDQVLADAAAEGLDSVAISTTGHADRSGSEDYNLALSLRRADAVREALVAGGVPAEAITVAGRGESEPAVPTADGVREQANRRVEIILQ
ncbi:MAG: OmpA family protein [Dongiaceae bacterium]